MECSGVECPALAACGHTKKGVESVIWEFGDWSVLVSGGNTVDRKRLPWTQTGDVVTVTVSESRWFDSHDHGYGHGS